MFPCHSLTFLKGPVESELLFSLPLGIRKWYKAASEEVHKGHWEKVLRGEGHWNRLTTAVVRAPNLPEFKERCFQSSS